MEYINISEKEQHRIINKFELPNDCSIYTIRMLKALEKGSKLSIKDIEEKILCRPIESKDYDFFIENSCIVVYGEKKLPYKSGCSVINESISNIKDITYKGVEYKAWLWIENDYDCNDCIIYYPKGLEESLTKKRINVLYRGSYINEDIAWIHTKRGLFVKKIFPILLIDFGIIYL